MTLGPSICCATFFSTDFECTCEYMVHVAQYTHVHVHVSNLPAVEKIQILARLHSLHCAVCRAVSLTTVSESLSVWPSGGWYLVIERGGGGGEGCEGGGGREEGD